MRTIEPSGLAQLTLSILAAAASKAGAHDRESDEYTRNPEARRPANPCHRPTGDTTTNSSKRPGSAALAAAIAFCLSALGPAAALGDEARYEPLQSISYELGSKFMSGYFLQEAGTCVVTLLVIEKIDPDAPLAVSPTRLRLPLRPGEIAGVDSEEGQSLNVTCGELAATVLVDLGDRDRLVAQQAMALKKQVASVWRE